MRRETELNRDGDDHLYRRVRVITIAMAVIMVGLLLLIGRDINGLGGADMGGENEGAGGKQGQDN